MFQELRQHWQQFKTGKPGRRFQDRYWRRKKESKGRITWGTVSTIGLGLACIIGGIVMLAIPGPGLVVLTLGLALLASEFYVFARFLDWAEPKVRAWWAKGRKLWAKLSLTVKVLLLAVAALVALAAAYGAYCVMD